MPVYGNISASAPFTPAVKNFADESDRFSKPGDFDGQLGVQLDNGSFWRWAANEGSWTGRFVLANRYGSGQPLELDGENGRIAGSTIQGSGAELDLMNGFLRSPWGGPVAVDLPGRKVQNVYGEKVLDLWAVHSFAATNIDSLFWTATTAPSGTIVAKYGVQRAGMLVTFWARVTATTAGSNVMGLLFSLPSIGSSVRSIFNVATSQYAELCGTAAFQEQEGDRLIPASAALMRQGGGFPVVQISGPATNAKVVLCTLQLPVN